MATILAIHAHPDDIEILAGGTMAMLAAAGNRVVFVSMTPGDCGSHKHGPDEIAAIRRKEATAAARLAGAEYRCAEFRDLAVFSDDPSRRRVTEILRLIQPDLVITSSPMDYMCDHEATSALVRDACFAAPAPNYKTGASGPAAPIPAIPHLYFMDAVGGVDRENRPILPDFVVDVGKVFERKKAMLAEHGSQREWLRQHHGIDEYLDLMERWTRANGRRAGIEMGEGFRHYKGHPYPESPLLEELLGPNVVHAPAVTG
jgi:LmbE family N-acetylglucosaminyl deacetylase